MEELYHVRDVSKAGRTLLEVNKESGTGHLLCNMAEQAVKNKHSMVHTTLPIVGSAVRAYYRNLNELIAMYAD